MQYGGKASNKINRFWPPSNPSDNFGEDKSLYINNNLPMMPKFD